MTDEQAAAGRASIARKLCAAMKAVKSVPKLGRNEYHRYKYVKEEDVAEEVRDAMANAGLALGFDIEKMDTEVRKTERGGDSYLTTLRLNYTLLDSDTGAEWRFRMIGQASDNQDKGLYKALTGAQKYVYLKLLMIGSGDDPEEAGVEAKPAPARGTIATQFKPGDPATHTDVRAAQKGMQAGPPMAPVTAQKAATKAPAPPAKPSLARPKIAEGPAITDEEWDRQVDVWNEDPDAATLVPDVKQYYGIRTIAELTATQRYGFMLEMEKRLSEIVPPSG